MLTRFAFPCCWLVGEGDLHLNHLVNLTLISWVSACQVCTFPYLLRVPLYCFNFMLVRDTWLHISLQFINCLFYVPNLLINPSFFF